jgi:hypothetical protein
MVDGGYTQQGKDLLEAAEILERVLKTNVPQ